MNREILQQLVAWKTADNRKPLLLYGARQVGKTHTLNTFAKQVYQTHIYLNFENNPILKQYFEGSLDPKDLIYKLSIHFNQTITPEHTLIIFDEVQECPQALNSLKYFHEFANEYHVCACGSLLGVKIGHKEGFPVGQVNFFHLYPLSFMEFLDAIGECRLKNHLTSIQNIEPLPEPFHNMLNEFLRIYYFTGGMPEAVLTYIQTKDFNAVRNIHHDILKSYDLDFAKHATKTLSMRISEVWQAIPNQLAKENKKFVYSLVRRSARAREYEEAIQWLNAAGLIHKIYNISAPKMPLNAYANWNNFKVYLLDVGLLNTLAGLPVQTLLTGNQLFQEFKGSLTENFVFQTLALDFDKQYYWTSQGTAEVDGVVQLENSVYPLEIKANTSTKSKSLQSFVTKYQPTLSLRTSMLNLKLDGKILNLPLYLLTHLKQLAKSAQETV